MGKAIFFLLYIALELLYTGSLMIPMSWEIFSGEGGRVMAFNATFNNISVLYDHDCPSEILDQMHQVKCSLLLSKEQK